MVKEKHMENKSGLFVASKHSFTGNHLIANCVYIYSLK